MLQIFKGYVLAKLKDEKGQGMVEYGLIIGLVAIAVIVVLGLLGGGLTTKFQAIVDALK
jgi:pilus assembly protein Flp/PilA